MDRSIYLKVSDAVHTLLWQEHQRDGVPMSVVVRRAVLEHYNVHADGTPRETKATKR